MGFLLALAMLADLTAPTANPLAAPEGAQTGCWVEPLKLSLPELAAMGRLEQQLAQSYCLRQPGASFVRHLNRYITVGQTRFGTFNLFGEKLGFGLDVVVNPGVLGHPDVAYAIPSFDLPPAWDRALNTMTYPVLIVGGTAMMTYVIVSLLSEQFFHAQQPPRRPPGR